jgi:hypothetical protein
MVPNKLSIDMTITPYLHACRNCNPSVHTLMHTMWRAVLIELRNASDEVSRMGQFLNPCRGGSDSARRCSTRPCAYVQKMNMRVSQSVRMFRK